MLEAVPAFLKKNIIFRVFSRSANIDSKNSANIKTDFFKRDTPIEVNFRSDILTENINKWKEVIPVGAGLANVGNTCFLNSILQCILYTPAFYNNALNLTRENYLRPLFHSHEIICDREICLVCEIIKLTDCVFKPTDTHSVKPLSFVVHLKSYARTLRYGRQEDAHEYFLYLLEGIQKDTSRGLDKEDRNRFLGSKKDFVQAVFGGTMLSRIICSNCSHNSDCYENFFDISLDIKHSNSIDNALKFYTAPEKLSFPNSYNCQNCKTSAEANKKLTISKSPEVLVLHLKRFDSFGNKLCKNISFSPLLDLSKFVSENIQSKAIYQLYALVVHNSSTSNSGHYIAFVKAPNDFWYCMNDSSVSISSWDIVSRQQAYILFYKKNHEYGMLAEEAAFSACSTSTWNISIK